MEKELFETLQVLKAFNEKLGSKIISKEEFKEEENNINKFVDHKKSLQNLLQHIKQIDLENKDLFGDNLLELHFKYAKLVWQFDEMHELIIKLVRNFNTNFPKQQS